MRTLYLTLSATLLSKMALLFGRSGQVERYLQVLVPMVRIGRLPIVQKDMLPDVVTLTDVLEQHHIIVCRLGTVASSKSMRSI